MASAQKISVEATKLKIRLANDLYVLNERLVAEAAAMKMGHNVQEARTLMLSAFESVNQKLASLSDGDTSAGLDKEYSVAVQFILTDLQDVWNIYGADVQALAGKDAITVEDIEKVLVDNDAFGQKVKELVDIIYDVYGSVIFSTEDLRALTLLSHERRHIEKIKENMVLAAVLPDREKYVGEMVRLGNVFTQTIDVLIRNGAMFGVASPPSPEAVAALERVEADWLPKSEMIVKIAENGAITLEEVTSFFGKADTVADGLDAVIEAYNAALPRS